MDIVIRPAVVGDADAIQRINREELGYDYALDKTRQRLTAILENPVYHVLVAQQDGEVAGYIHLQDYDCAYADPMKNVLAIAVAGAQRGRGVGRALMEAAEAWAKETGAAGIRLSSGHNRTGAHRFYEWCGYVCRKEQKNFVRYF